MKKGWTMLLLVLAMGAVIFLLLQKEESSSSVTTKSASFVTLNDFLISAVQGDYMVKMTVTLVFQDENGYVHFKGATSEKTEEAHPSTMEVQVNSLVSSYMLQVKESDIANKQKIENDLNDYLNAQLKEELIGQIYIENYVFQ